MLLYLQILKKVVRKLPPVNGISDEMLFGPAPTQLFHRNATNGKSGLIITHGYCSKNNPFAASSSDFTNPYFFSDLNKNRSNKQFAELLIAYAQQQQLTSYGMIAHSQGGMAALHILNFYNTGLDVAQGSRVVQTVGTPFNGNSAAGTAADLVKIFGISCGANFDLSKDGAVLWLSSISAAAKKKVYYYTSTVPAFPYCSLATSLLLINPNDGVCELEKAQLSGSNNMGNTQGWCHTDSMSKPSQCEDHTRNKAMSANAAR